MPEALEYDLPKQLTVYVDKVREDDAKGHSERRKIDISILATECEPRPCRMCKLAGEKLTSGAAFFTGQRCCCHLF